MCRDSVDRFAGASIVLRRVADVGRSTGKKSASPVKLLVENGPCCVGRMPREVRRAAGEHSNSTSLGLFDHGKRVSFCLSFVRSFFDSVERSRSFAGVRFANFDFRFFLRHQKRGAVGEAAGFRFSLRASWE